MNKLRLTEQGRQAINNASQGGIFIRPEKFKIGDSDFPHDPAYFNIQGDELYAGKVNFVQVHSTRMVSFILTIPSHAFTSNTIIKEVGIFSKENVMLARCVFDTPYTILADTNHELIAILSTNECDLTVIDVTVGDYTSVPQTPYVYSLPDPVESDHNTVIVMNCIDRGNMFLPAFAIRQGAGNFQWAFTGHDVVYTGKVSVSDAKIRISDLNYANGETFIVSIVSGAGAGEVRRYRYNETTDYFIETEDHPFSVINESSFVTVWKATESGSLNQIGGGTGRAVVLYPVHAVAGNKNPQTEFEEIAINSTQLTTTCNTEFIINAPTSSGNSVPLLPYVGQGKIGISTAEEVQQWIAGDWPNTPKPEKVTTENGFVTTEIEKEYAYFLAPYGLGKVTFVDRSVGLAGGWDGATWPDDGEVKFGSYAPIILDFDVNGQSTKWRLYRLDFPSKATFDYSFENAGLDLSVSGSGAKTKKGYFAYPVELGEASFYNITDSKDESWNGPFTVSRTINRIEKDWYVYETQDAGFGQRRYAITYKNPCLTIVAGNDDSGGFNTQFLPDREGIPPDWVLQVGEETPLWAAQKRNNPVANVLYIPPAQMRITVFNFVGDGATRRYPLGDLAIKNNNFVVAALGGITQHKTAYEIQGNEIEFAENIPPNVVIDIRVITKEAGNGTFVDFHTTSYVSDGSSSTYQLEYLIENVEYCFVYIRSVLQTTTAYTYNSENNTITFAEQPPAGIEIEITCLVKRSEMGYSTEVVTQQLITVAPTMFLELPLYPETKDCTFLSISGSHVHRNLYSILGNKLVMRDFIPAGRDVETVIYNNVKAEGSERNNLTGVATDIILTSKAVKMIRHNAPPVQMPIPSIELKSGKGIRVTGKYPDYVIESTLAERYTPYSNFKLSNLVAKESTSEVIHTWKMDLTHDVMLTVICDFAVELGVGFEPNGFERLEYVIGIRTTSMREPDYGRRIKGTGVAGLQALDAGIETTAYGNASLTQVFDLIKSNNPSGFVEIVAKARVANVDITKYESYVSINFNVIGTPKIQLG